MIKPYEHQQKALQAIKGYEDKYLIWKWGDDKWVMYNYMNTNNMR